MKFKFDSNFLVHLRFIPYIYLETTQKGASMAFQTIFKRYELKYLITQEQKGKILKAIEPYMVLDKYGRTTIRNLYFDTNDYRLIRRSIEKPEYKEKLRVRSYSQADSNSTVFIELKKKYKHVVYKRRLALTENDAMCWLCSKDKKPQTQISKEIDYFLDYYKTLHPTVFLAYDREAYYTKEKSDFRLTFDDNIIFRTEDLSLKYEAYGVPILEDDLVLMEIKCSGGIPLWMTKILSENHIYKTSFSKYGTVYQKHIHPKITEGNFND